MDSQTTVLKPKRNLWRDIKRHRSIYLLLLIPMAYFIIFKYIPIWKGQIAFKNFMPRKGVLGSEWVGLANFQEFFHSFYFWELLRNTIMYSVGKLLISVPLSIILAVSLYECRIKVLRKTVQTLTYLPHFLSWLFVSYFGMAFLSVNKGLVNQVLSALGRDPVQWYMSPQYWPYILIGANLWKNVGYGMVLYLASITNIDTTLYEAAVVDGATKWQQVRYITLPMLKPMAIILFILSLGGIFHSDFGLFYIMPRDQGALVNVTQTIDVYVYKALMRMNNIGFASAAAFLQSIFGFVTIYTANYIVKRLDPERGLF